LARTIDTIVGFMQYIIRKERGVFQTDAEATANLDMGQLDAFEEWFKLYGVNQQVHDALRPFRVYYQFTSDGAGFVTYPPNYSHILGTPFTVSGSTVNEITFYNEDEFPRQLKSQLRAVTINNPIALTTNIGFSIYPQILQIGFFNYLRRPNTPILATIQSGRTIFYDAANSVNLEWEDQYINHIIAKALKYVGLNMDETSVYQFADQYDKETQ